MMNIMKKPTKPRPNRGQTLSRIILIILSSFLLALLYVWIFINESQFHFLQKLSHYSTINSNNTSNSNTTLLVNSTGIEDDDIRILIGIPTLPDHYHKRHFLRMVYGTQPLKGARVDVRFVFCSLTKEDQKVLVALEIMRHQDIIILNCTENMDNGKTYTYFSSLPDLLNDPDSPNNPPYHYVMKGDDDTYFRLEKLVESLRPLPREDLYYGAVIPCKSTDPFVDYMSGMGYLISWDLVEWIKDSEIARNNTQGPEDRLVGEWFREGRRAKNRHSARWAMYDYPFPHTGCTHELWPDTIAVHRLKNQEKWIATLAYFNVTNHLKPSKLYRIPTETLL